MDIIFIFVCYTAIQFLGGMSTSVFADLKKGPADGISPAIGWAIWSATQLGQIILLAIIIKLGYPYLEAIFG
ncbi:hypothetical protein SM033_00026 [Vibrio phage vB_VpaM_sm033]|nr:hypothetical protein SM033_00026 [Vibrio phage vB_VpaM_sm033]